MRTRHIQTYTHMHIKEIQIKGRMLEETHGIIICESQRGQVVSVHLKGSKEGWATEDGGVEEGSVWPGGVLFCLVNPAGGPRDGVTNYTLLSQLPYFLLLLE